MFEGLVHRVLVGYLGRYVKDIHKDQLKLSLWNEEVLLENVDLIPEAFDYLQLPFAIKHGRVGRLSIKVSWKKLGWDYPINIVLEDVFICASQRDDKEWNLDEVEKREFAGKKAQLAAAELTKLSRCVCDNQAGKSFISYITAKVLDSIQLSIRNFHVQYVDQQFNSAQALALFGLKFSSLTVKQNLVGLFGAKVFGSQVNKIVEIEGLEIYCSTSNGGIYSSSMDDSAGPKLGYFVSDKDSEFDHLLKPFNASVSLLVSRAGKLDSDVPQYSIRAEITSLALFLNEVQLQQILILLDYLSTSQLREKYGRYRPWDSPLSRKDNGWQKLWWHYAQQSILADVRKKLKKTSWRYFGQRLLFRQKYVKLYKTKLDFLQREQSIDEYVLRELEEMEKESDIDDILSYRSAAEFELQKSLQHTSCSIMGGNAADFSIEKSQQDERPSGRPRGWLNWLSRGMLGAGGTDDSDQFSGAVSDEIVKDIYEATKFHPSVALSEYTVTNDKLITCAITCSIGQISAALKSKNSSKNILDLVLKDLVTECKLWEELATLLIFIKSAEMFYPCHKKAILKTGKVYMEDNAQKDEKPSCKVQLDVSPKREPGISLKVMIQPLEVTFHMDFLQDIMEFARVFRSFEFHQERVLLSLNGIDDVKTRLLSKAECILSGQRKLCWDVSIFDIIVNVPWGKAISEQCNLVMELGSLVYTSQSDVDSVASSIEKQCSNTVLRSNVLTGFQVHDLYNYSEVKLVGFEFKLFVPQHSQGICVVEKLGASVSLAACIISDESLFKQLEVFVNLPSLSANFSTTIYESVLALTVHVNNQSRHESLAVRSPNQPWASAFCYSISASLELVSFHLDTEDDGENSSEIVVSLQKLDIRYSHMEFEECWVCTKALKISSSRGRAGKESHILCSSGNNFSPSIHQDFGIRDNNKGEAFNNENGCGEACFLLHYEAHRSANLISHECTVGLNDTDLHCFPYIFGLLVGFCDRISSCAARSVCDNVYDPAADAKNPKQNPGFVFQRFGCSNFFETGSPDHASISLDCFPFITINNSGSLGSLESSLRYTTPDWRKIFNIRERKLKGQKFSLKRGSKHCHLSTSTSTPGDSFTKSGGLRDTDIYSVDINLSGVKVHFHDATCIVGTVTIPNSKSSLSICEDSMDLLCSTEGLSLTSSWWTKNFHEYLWGPSLTNLSPIFNLRVRKRDIGLLASELEVSLGIQHVYCILPPEYVAIIIGYFSLPDWNTLSEQSVSEKGHHKTEGKSDIVYKFEVLDSTLILPMEQDDHLFLKIEIQQLYCSFIPNCTMVDVVMDIPPGYMVPAHKVAKANNCLNLFGRDLFLSFLLCKEDAHGRLLLDKDAECGNISLIAPLSADVWVRIPCDSNTQAEISSGSTCIMSRIHNCQLFADDCHTLDGIKVLLDVIEQFCSVEDESKNFTSDVLLFHQLKGSLKGNDAAPASSSEKVSTEMLCCVDSLVIKLCHSNKDTILSEPIAMADMQFLCSLSLINETLVGLDCHFSSLGLLSLPTSVMLARCTGSCSSASALHIYLFNGTDGKIELHVSLPSLDVWLYLFEWIGVVDLCNSVARRMVETASMNVPSECSSKDVAHLPERVALVISPDSLRKTVVPADGVPGYVKRDSVSITVRSEDVGVTIHFPACTEAAPCKLQAVEIRKASFYDVSNKILEGENCKFFTVTAHSTSTELFVVGRKVNLKCNLDKISGNVDKNITTLPFFQISQVAVLGEICCNHDELANFDVGIQCDLLDVQLSHKLFCFWNDVRLDRIGGQYSNSSFGRLDLSVQLKKVSLLISDERWSCGGPMIEIVVANFLLGAVVIDNSVETSVTSELEVNYNNFHKVVWEPFIEPWSFHLNVIRKHEMTALLNSSILTDICLDSTAQLNLNFTESLIECIFRTVAMVKDAWQLMDPMHQPENQRSLGSQFSGSAGAGSYAPYVLQNLTSLPLVYHVFQGLVGDNEFNTYEKKDTKSVQPGDSVPIYLNEIPGERLYGPVDSDKLGERQSNGVVHHYMSIQLDGTSLPSSPISMDLVGLTYFEVDFSKASKKTESEKTGDILKCSMSTEESARFNPGSGFVVPVVFDVSLQRYSKLIRLYSTVILSNATSVPLELRFDIPFGVSPKILDPIYPGQEFPLPLHLAEAGRLRWRPHGNCYLWSEVQDISKILSQESTIGFLRSFVCYPSLPSSDPFRCCISVQKYSLLASGKPRKASSLLVDNSLKQSVGGCIHDLENSQRSIYQVTLSTPLVVNNYLPDEVSLTIENGGVTRTVLLSEGKTFFHHVDPSHDLGLEFYLHGFLPSSLTFPRTETFGEMAKFTGTKFSLTDTMLLEPNLSNGPLCITVEKTMDAFSGSRELFIFVPFLLYNCTGFPLNISESSKEMDSSPFTIPSCYNLIEQQVPKARKDSLSLLASDQDSVIEKDKASIVRAPHFDSRDSSLSKTFSVLGSTNADSAPGRFVSKPAILPGSSIPFSRQLGTSDVCGEKTCMYNRSIGGSMSMHSEVIDLGRGKVKACMYSPRAVSSINEISVRVSRHVPDCVVENVPNLTWSAPFLLVPPSGSSAVLVPESSSHAAFVVSVTSNALSGSFAGRTQAITFQPRFVISNACNKDLCYKQKGTDVSFHLGIGQHSQLLWTDTTRELLVSIRFDEPGWQWSGSFLPDHLGDTQVKMWNYVSGTLSMIRVEVQNANVSITDEEIIGSLRGNSGTILILLSDDDTGFMPYRIDNFSKERLRIYQQRCETCDTVVHPYTYCPYAWDEPCYPHRLTVEVPGERVLGSYAIDDLTEYIPLHLKSTSEKPERTLLLSVHAEGATKVLSVVDSSQHVLQDVKYPTPLWSRGKTKPERKQKDLAGYKEKFSLALPCIGISLINAYPQELLFVCAKNITFDLLQSLDQQKLSFQISSLQMDNQLHTTQYPVILSFNKEYRSNTAGQRAKSKSVKSKSESGFQITSESTCEPVLHLAVAIWRKKDISLVSFEYISLRVASFRLEVEQELILSLLDFFKALSRFQSMVLPVSDPTHYPLVYDVGAEQAQSYKYVKYRANQLHGISFPAFNRTQTSSASLPSVVPIGAPWQQIYLLARRQKKIYVELFDLAPIKFTLSFSSAPWVLRNGVLTSGEFLIHRGLMALADVEGARIHLKLLKIDHLMASWESMQDILTRHYTRQLLHEMYKVFGSAGVIGNPMGFARSLGLGIRDFLSVPARGIFQSPTGLITGMAQGTTSLLSNTVYALSDAATQFSKTAHKGIVAFTFDDQSVERMNKQQKGVASHSKGVINEVLEGLTGLLQSPIKEVEKHGLPGVLSGIALGVTGLVARPAASILEVTGKTAQSIRNRSRVYQLGYQRYRVRLPRPLSRELPLRPYSLEEAVGASVLREADDGLKLKDEVLVMCKSLEQSGKFIVITERLMLIVRCPSLVDVGKAEFRGVPIDPEWVIEMEIGLDSVIHADAMRGVVNIIANSSETLLKQKQLQSRKSGGTRTKQWMNPNAFPLYQTNLESASEKDAEDLLRVLLSTMEQGKVRGWSSGTVCLSKGTMTSSGRVEFGAGVGSSLQREKKPPTLFGTSRSCIYDICDGIDTTKRRFHFPVALI